MWAVVAGVAVLGALAGALFVGGDRRCRGVELRGGAAADVEVGQRPPIGGGGLGDLRRAFSDDQVAYCDDFADPYVLVAGGEHFAYSTNSDGLLVPLLRVGNLFREGRRHDALAALPGWAAQNATRVWAPGVLARGEGFVLYYTVGARDGRQCISLAAAEGPGGPFVDRSTGPFVCPEAGAIDPSPFVAADGQAFLLWKDQSEDAVVASRVSDDGRGLVGDTRVLLRADQAWEAGVVEGPSMVAERGQYHLFYSANDWRTADYAVGYAVCEGPLGPCDKPSAGPWLASSNGAQGPGGPELFRDAAGLWMAVHAWVGGRVGYPDGARNLFVLRMVFTEAGPVGA